MLVANDRNPTQTTLSKKRKCIDLQIQGVKLQLRLLSRCLNNTTNIFFFSSIVKFFGLDNSGKLYSHGGQRVTSSSRYGSR